MRDALDKLQTGYSTKAELGEYAARFFPPDKLRIPPMIDTSQLRFKKINRSYLRFQVKSSARLTLKYHPNG